MSQTHAILVDNIKCGGCSHTITTRLMEISQVRKVNVIPENEAVEVVAPDEALDEIYSTLESLGYPRKGTSTGLSNIRNKARSVVSCAIGKIDGP